MHVRLSTCFGMALVVAETQERLGTLQSLLIHPDTGAIEGICFFVGGMMGREEHCVQTLDIVHWGLRIDVRSAEAAGPLEECVRFQDILREGRMVLGQRILTEGGRSLGWCRDIQFDTERFQVEWLFPRQWFRWGRPLPLAAILEVRPDAIVVLETEVPEKEPFLRREILKAEGAVTQPSRSFRENLFRRGGWQGG
ncbi:hypothetical protein A3H22_00255 [Candidatus Peribacteria bacterium RIFCSPLOWO2_12_FULL_55_15]|nr:MAG: hypothetical protein A2789_02360 [Candidatus Peribacteria bacterium RIFCSPHIGHO2_01_FULL_54_22]OGJ63346.1 MAG: hypothetical protein A3D12_00235 [Candidatus Peribacteria bacterium RIFCSPHIGHO2_02_FULL_55_24]OGJ69751.1 MAG: hypothetical protein A3H90_01650 [Candidatus Peribacteria bacterium RIFCSPLOWO2_02_FULL_55_36]OGJ70326.1 MAG: hypothetical protein A3H22_00255 [Candidatus Peribacteria bacterium RIFCSPLOWO2_12_FULL_55_15]